MTIEIASSRVCAIPTFPAPKKFMFSYVVSLEDEGQRELEDAYLTGEAKELAVKGLTKFKGMYVVKRIFRWSSGNNTVVLLRSTK